MLAQVGLDAESGAQMSIEAGVLILRKPGKAVRDGWAEAAQKIAASGNDGLVVGEFANEIDSTLVW